MCKKIAHLTKQVCSLQEQIDDDEKYEKLKEAHEEEIKCIKSETRDQIVDLRSTIKSLKTDLKNEESQKKNALAELEDYKQKAMDEQRRIKALHLKKVEAMSREKEDMQDSYEERLTFQQAQIEQKTKKIATRAKNGTYKRSKQSSVQPAESEKQQHQKSKETRAALQEEVSSLSEEIKKLRKDKDNQAEEYEEKLRKLRAAHEREIESYKRMQLKSVEEARQECRAHETALQKTIVRLRTELGNNTKDAKEKLAKYDQLQSTLNTAENTIIDLKKEINALSQNAKMVETVKRKLRISNLQATQKTQEVTIQELTNENKNLKAKLQSIEQERRSTTLAQRQEQQRSHNQALKKVLEEERATHKKNIDRVKAQHERKTKLMKDNFAKKLEEVNNNHRLSMKTTVDNAEKDKTRLLGEQEQKFELERFSMQEQQRRLKQQFDELQEELAKTTEENSWFQKELFLAMQNKDEVEQKLFNLEKTHNTLTYMKIANLQAEFREEHKAKLEEANSTLLEELNLTKDNLQKTSTELTALQKELDSQKQQHKAKMIAVKEEGKAKMKKTVKELELQWAENQKRKEKTLYEEFKLTFKEEQNNALAELSITKDKELNSAQIKWKEREDSLIKQVRELQFNLEIQLSKSQEFMEQIHVQMSEEREHHRTQLEELQTEQKQSKEQDKTESQLLKGELINKIKLLEDQLKTTTREYEQREQQLRENQQNELKNQRHKHNNMIDTYRKVHHQKITEISELQDEVSREKKLIHTLEEKVSSLTAELQVKNEKLFNFQGYMIQQLNEAESELAEKHEEEISRLTMAHDCEKSRLESDIDADLREKLSERDLQIEALLYEKKIHDLEKANRDKNFNKVFNASPNSRKQKQNNEKSFSPKRRNFTQVKDPEDTRKLKKQRSLSASKDPPLLPKTQEEQGESGAVELTEQKTAASELEKKPVSDKDKYYQLYQWYDEERTRNHKLLSEQRQMKEDYESEILKLQQTFIRSSQSSRIVKNKWTLQRETEKNR
ncbi:hypothetical protein WMY93_005559 [Mugilogobius chulae]|uniref:Protein FAM184A/B N-terminal domain-containing protein n=1 Tax=Mugilogobius chulae TaxID=88201 RepID=A0AAW0PR85_9GOBI